MSNSLQNLPPEMQERIQQIIANGSPNVQVGEGPPPAMHQQVPSAPIQKTPSLMDHLIALRQEVDMMRHEMGQLNQTIDANSNVVEAVGQAVGSIYQMFQTTTNQSPTYSQNFQQQAQVDDGTDY